MSHLDSGFRRGHVAGTSAGWRLRFLCVIQGAIAAIVESPPVTSWQPCTFDVLFLFLTVQPQTVPISNWETLHYCALSIDSCEPDSGQIFVFVYVLDADHECKHHGSLINRSSSKESPPSCRCTWPFCSVAQLSARPRSEPISSTSRERAKNKRKQTFTCSLDRPLTSPGRHSPSLFCWGHCRYSTRGGQPPSQNPSTQFEIQINTLPDLVADRRSCSDRPLAPTPKWAFRNKGKASSSEVEADKLGDRFGFISRWTGCDETWNLRFLPPFCHAK